MLNPQASKSSQSTQLLLFQTQHCKRFNHRRHSKNISASPILSSSFLRPSLSPKRLQRNSFSFGDGRETPKAGHNNNVETSTAHENSIIVNVVVTLHHPKVSGIFKNLSINRDFVGVFFTKTLLLEIVASYLDPNTGLERDSIKVYAKESSNKEDKIKYETKFKIPFDFGDVGAILVENRERKEVYIEEIALEGFPNGPLKFICSSWVHSKFDNPVKRVFFPSKYSWLESETPNGVMRLRKAELANLRGDNDHLGERRHFERIYDYDVYNDIGDPDKSFDLKRPLLGGKQYPYPRRCRTGRPRCISDPASERRINEKIYVPRDECFSEVKQTTFLEKLILAAVRASVATRPDGQFLNDNVALQYFHFLYSIGHDLSPIGNQLGVLKMVLPLIFVKAIKDIFHNIGTNTTSTQESVKLSPAGKLFWFRDDEFARQTLAGINPTSIRLITEWPLMSKLDSDIYGPQESAITEDVIKKEIGGIMNVDEAIEEKKLFILDYYDILLPFVNKVRDHKKGTALYGSRTVFFLNEDGTLRLLAIELTRPPANGKPQWKRVFTPSNSHSTCVWLWRLAKVHVLAHDTGYHQLVSHWLKSHCVTEPYIIATNRQLSVMHPIHRLLKPYFRGTMEINALARGGLLNVDSIIENNFSLGKYSAELSSIVYDREWRFNLQALPAELISRGMAVEDPTAPHGLKLTIEDYPYANDGLILWDSLKEWVSDYVNHYYTNPTLVETDKELQTWWTEIRAVGHADKKDKPWWPILKTPNDLIEIITTMTWVTSGYHAAVNFGQYSYAAGGDQYFPNRPTTARMKMPTEDPTSEDWNILMENPKCAMMKCFQSQLQAKTVVAVIDLLSNHFPDEEYLGEKMEPCWGEDEVIKAAFERFRGRIMEVERIIEERNNNKNLKNRNGAGIMPYELLKPFSEPGVTGKGVPCSISI